MAQELLTRAQVVQGTGFSSEVRFLPVTPGEARLIAEVPAMLAILRSLASPGINHGASRELLARLGEG